MEQLGSKLRQQRHKMGLTLDELAVKAGVSKPYLSLIETGRVPNPPSDEKLARLEQALAFADGELISHAHLQRTPPEVRTVLSQLMQKSNRAGTGDDQRYARLLKQLHEQVEKTPGKQAAIPVINKDSTGYPRAFNDLTFPLTVATEFVSCPGLTDKDAFAARVAGDFMTPRYFPGDIIIFSPALKPRSGDDCFICFSDGDTTFRRIFLEKDENKKPVVRLQPRNEKHRPRSVPSGKITAMYRAVSRQHLLESE